MPRRLGSSSCTKHLTISTAPITIRNGSDESTRDSWPASLSQRTLRVSASRSHVIREITAGQVFPARLDTHLLSYDLMSLYVYRNSAPGKPYARPSWERATWDRLAYASLLSRLHSEVVSNRRKPPQSNRRGACCRCLSALRKKNNCAARPRPYKLG
jgi:hypothetical protein